MENVNKTLQIEIAEDSGLIAGIGRLVLEQVCRDILDTPTLHGKVAVNVSADGRAATLLELNCETDFVARNEDFNSFGKGCCLAAAAFAPAFLNREAVDAAAVERERAIVVDQTNTAMKGKPNSGNAQAKRPSPVCSDANTAVKAIPVHAREKAVQGTAKT